jgi:diguanylate cyclase (GGDEF)-like protein/PAS domain S-box-containing protein
VNKPYKIILVAIATALFFGLLDGLAGYYFFHDNDKTLLDVLFFDVPSDDLYHRVVLIVALLFIGGLAGRYMQKAELLKIREIQSRAQACALESEVVQNKINEIIPITRSDKQGVITFANEAYARLTGYSIEELIGQKHDILRHPSTPSSFYRSLWQTIARGDVWEGEIKNVKKNGDEFYIYTHIMPEYDDAGKRIGYIAIRSNITDVKALEKMVTQDALTGVLNRREFDRRMAWQIEEAMRYGMALSLIYMDIDHFKQINDRYGHLVGDEVLKNFAQLISKRLRGSDSFARIGGEEFAIILPHTERSHAAEVAEALRKDIENSMFNDVGRVTASFGVVQLDNTFDTSSTLLRKADKALYDSKSAGRNRVTVSTL